MHWRLDNALYDLRSPYYRRDRDDELFFSSLHALLVEEEFARIKAKYDELAVRARAELLPTGENRVVVAARKLSRRMVVDAETVADVQHFWKVKFGKEQIGFGKTGVQSASGGIVERSG